MPIFDTAFGANGTFSTLAASSGYRDSTFITDLQEGLAGTLAGSLRVSSGSAGSLRRRRSTGTYNNASVRQEIP